MLRIIFAAFLWLISTGANAQTSPNLTYGQVLTPAQWNNLFVLKQDTLGFTPLNTAGGIMTGRLVTAPPSSTTSGFNLTCGSVPASPVNGDQWCTAAGLFVQINGATVGPLAQTGGTNVFMGQQTTQGLTTTSPGWFAQITGDANARVRIGLNSTDIPSIAFGIGSAVRDTFIERAAAASIRLGSPDAAAAVAQTLGVQNVVAGTSNTAGANLTIDGSQGTGTGAGGRILFQTAPLGSSGSTQNALVTALTIFPSGALATGAATDQGAGNLNLAGGTLYNNGTAPTGTGAYMRGIGPTMSGPTITGTIAGSPAITSPTINAGALSGTFSGSFTFSGAPSLTGLSSGTCSNSVVVNSAGLLITGACPGAASSIQDGSTAIASGVASTLLFNNAGVLGHLANGAQGTSVVMGASAPSFQPGTWVRLSTQTLSSQVTIFDSTNITATYNEYEIVVSGLTCSIGTATPVLQIGTGSPTVSYQATGYLAQVMAGNTSATSSQPFTTGIPLMNAGACPTSGAGVDAHAFLYKPSASAIHNLYGFWSVIESSGTLAVGGTMNGVWNTSGPITGAQIGISAGIFSATFTVYGRL